MLDTIRLQPGADLAAVTTAQLLEVVERLIAAGQWHDGDPDILVVLGFGYDAPRIAYLLAGLPVEILGRLRSDRVMRRPTPPRVHDPRGGRPPKHGSEFVFGDPVTWGHEQAVTVTDTRLYGKATAQALDRLHPRLTRRAAWSDYEGPLPIIEGTVIRLVVERLPSGG
ncbi:DDE superfamily endonuclease [Streptomyces sp. MnatMP-M27]|nr:DDE superfamily endonuclease [Streptomyces sp. MnatMP-M27]